MNGRWRRSPASTSRLSKLRLFFALWPPCETAEALHGWALEARRANGGRVTRAEAIHLTLAFLGEVDESRLTSLKSISPKSRKHRLPIEEAGYWARNRIVWVGPYETPKPLELLAVDLGSELREQGFRSEKRKFSAHVTLLRKVREPQWLPRLPAVDWPVEEFVLVRSQLSAQGLRYEIVERFPLS